MSCAVLSLNVLCVNDTPATTWQQTSSVPQLAQRRELLPPVPRKQMGVYVSGPPDLGAVRAVSSQATKKMFPARFPPLIAPGWPYKRQESIDMIKYHFWMTGRPL